MTVKANETTKKLFMTNGRERDIMRFSERNDQKDAREYSEEEAIATLMRFSYTEEKARKFIEGVKKNPFEDWIQWR